MTKKLYSLGIMALAATPALATDLWDQQAAFHTSNTEPNFIDQVFTDTTSVPFTTYAVSDVVVGAGGWNVTSVSIEVVVTSSTGVLGINQAELNVFANSGSLPAGSNDPTTGTKVNVTVSPDLNFTNVFYITASGLNLNLAAGEDWIGLTPIGSFAMNGETYIGYTNTNAANANFGDAVRNPSGQFGLPAGMGWGTMEANTNPPGTAPDYGAIDIQGTPAPEPFSMAFLGLGVVGLVARRRNRK